MNFLTTEYLVIHPDESNSLLRYISKRSSQLSRISLTLSIRKTIAEYSHKINPVYLHPPLSVYRRRL